MTPFRVLLAPEPPERTQELARTLSQAGFEIVIHTGSAGVGEAILERLPDMILLDAQLVATAIDPVVGSGSAQAWTPHSLEEVERSHIVATLRHTEGNKRRAAQLLGIARSTLIQKVRRYGISGAPEEPDPV